MSGHFRNLSAHLFISHYATADWTRGKGCRKIGEAASEVRQPSFDIGAFFVCMLLTCLFLEQTEESSIPLQCVRGEVLAGIRARLA